MQEIPKLWAHQEEAVKRANDHFALFFDPGTGKTATTINILRKVYSKEGRLLPTLVLCPPVVITNWKNEILNAVCWTSITRPIRKEVEEICFRSGHGRHNSRQARKHQPRKVEESHPTWY